MAVFEIRVNGERRFVGEDVTALTMAAEQAEDDAPERISLHVGLGTAGACNVQFLEAALKPGDEVAVSILSDAEASVADETVPESCSFCRNDLHDIRSLVRGRDVAICDSCLVAFHAVLTRRAELPAGVSMGEQSQAPCGFCLETPPKVSGVFVQNAAAICPQCLRACVEMTGALES